MMDLRRVMTEETPVVEAVRPRRATVKITGDPDMPITGPGAGPPVWHNALDGFSRGVEILVQRRSNSGLTGWLAYTYGVNRYTDRRTGETFDGD